MSHYLQLQFKLTLNRLDSLHSLRKSSRYPAGSPCQTSDSILQMFPKTGQPFRKFSTSLASSKTIQTYGYSTTPVSGPRPHTSSSSRYSRPSVVQIYQTKQLLNILLYVLSLSLCSRQPTNQFDSAPVPPTSDIGLVRTCHALYTNVIIHNLSRFHMIHHYVRPTPKCPILSSLCCPFAIGSWPTG